MSEHGAFMRVASAIGDLGSPFYQEERQRDVWNEASAVGFQSMLWLSLIAANVMIWVGRGTAIPYVFGLMVIMAVGSCLTVGYAARAGVDADEPRRMWRPVTALFLALFALLVVGLLVSVDWDASGFVASMGRGMTVGAAVAVLGMSGWMLWRRLRR